MIRFPNWLWPKTPRTNTSPSVRIGRFVHWACVGGSALLLAFSFFAFASAATAQESEAFNKASPAAQQAIRDMRAATEEAKQPWNQNRQNAPIVNEPTGGKRHNQSPSSVPNDLTKPLTPAQLNIAAAPSSAPANPVSGSVSLNEAYGKQQSNPYAQFDEQARRQRRGDGVDYGIISLLAAVVLALIGRGVRYILADE